MNAGTVTIGRRGTANDYQQGARNDPAPSLPPPPPSQANADCALAGRGVPCPRRLEHGLVLAILACAPLVAATAPAASAAISSQRGAWTLISHSHELQP
jgi:hypothetical protein